MNGFFPVIDFIKVSDKLDETLVISMKTLDPELYKLADGSIDYQRIKQVLMTYYKKLNEAPMYIDNIMINNRQLDLIIPKGYYEDISEITSEIYDSFDGNSNNFLAKWNLTEL